MNVAFRFGGTPYEVSERGLKLFAKEVLPVVKSWGVGRIRPAAGHQGRRVAGARSRLVSVFLIWVESRAGNSQRSSRGLSAGSIHPLAPASADGWIPATRAGMTVVSWVSVPFQPERL